ncbi:hypothetical protein ACFVY0_47670 [Streptomyces sp. NPDC058286]|uniref:hypothetical protein n=1 Tax=Streptomyces sp. NPDC058286 TaxID=3346422 RepID=UPI0036EA3341
MTTAPPAVVVIPCTSEDVPRALRATVPTDQERLSVYVAHLGSVRLMPRGGLCANFSPGPGAAGELNPAWHRRR